MSPSATHEMAKVLAAVREYLENNWRGSITLNFEPDQGFIGMSEKKDTSFKKKHS